jgi:hypothetical protein
MLHPHRPSDAGQVVREGDDNAAIAEFIRTRGVTRCPTACVLPTQGLVNAVDRVALKKYALTREQLYQTQAGAKADDSL